MGGFGITAADDLLLVEDVVMPRQTCDWASVQFDDDSVADLFDRQVDLGRSPEQFGRIWIHTHPGTSAAPSTTDVETFGRVFGRASWAVMFILAKQGATSARLRFNVGPGGQLELPVGIDRGREALPLDRDKWLAEYQRCVIASKTCPEVFDRLESDWLEYDRWCWGLTQQYWQQCLKEDSHALTF